MHVVRMTAIVIAASLLLDACATISPSTTDGSRVTAAQPPWRDAGLRSLASPSLRRFRSVAEFDAYRRRLAQLADDRDARVELARSNVDLLASNDAAEPPLECDPTIEDCGALEEVQVTGTRVARPSITNNQEPGVDEGDIVKQYGRFLIVLHDGRLFSVDTGTRPGTMALVDRVNVYRVADRGTWYDELLITDDHLIVTGYDYDQGASELAIFRIDPNGLLAFEATYYITSDDYYSVDNYASRLVDGHLVLYTPLYLLDFDSGEPVDFPKVRRWTEDQGFTDWQPLFGPTDIYLPIQRTLDPTVHTLSVCPVRGETFRCQSTGVTGPSQREFYVSSEYAYVWVSFTDYDIDYWHLPDCPPGIGSTDFAALPAALYRLPLFGGQTEAVLTTGTPRDQFSLDARENEFLALLRWTPEKCQTDGDYPLRYARIPSRAFSSRPALLEAKSYTPLPTPPGSDVENRFTEHYLVYGGSQGKWQALYSNESYQTTEIVAVPVDDPDALSVLRLAHSAERVEVFGDNVIVDGYGSASGLSVSSIDLVNAPHVADVEYLDRVLESEGRSHAFNALAENDGSGYFGLPTIFKQDSWRSYQDKGSNVHFFAVDANLTIRSAGDLEPAAESSDEDYECEVSCVDWYGNARPIFTDGRVFALTGTELIEGYFAGGRILELQRVSLTGTPRYQH